MTNKELANFLGITEPTIYNWKKEKPNLYNVIMEWKNNAENTVFNDGAKEIMNLYKQLNDDEKRMYLAEINLRILKKYEKFRRNTKQSKRKAKLKK